MVDAIIGYFLAGRMSTSLPHRLSSTAELVSLYFTAILLCNCAGIHQDDKGNENSSPKAVWMSVSKQIQEVNKPDSHSLVINRKTEGEETICQGQDGTQIEFSSWPLKMLTFHLLIISMCLTLQLA